MFRWLLGCLLWTPQAWKAQSSAAPSLAPAVLETAERSGGRASCLPSTQARGSRLGISDLHISFDTLGVSDILTILGIWDHNVGNS